MTTANRTSPTTHPGAAAPARDSTGRRARIEGLLLGLAAGDAAGWPAARHRAARMPEWTRRLTRELDTFAEQNATTTLPVPIALNQPPEPLRLGPSDDAEWAAFAAGTVLTSAAGALQDLSPGRRMRAAVDAAWNALAAEVAAAAARAPEVESAVLPLRARISVRAGLGNLAAGLRPPATGHDNPHYFDDAACVRAAVLAVVHPGDPGAAADLAEFDARYTQDGDGVHGARAMAAAIAEALGGADVDTAVNAALDQLPDGTEIARNAAHAVRIARDFAGEKAGAFALVPVLEHQIVDHVYSYGIAAPRPSRSPSPWPPRPRRDRAGGAVGGLPLPGRGLRARAGRGADRGARLRRLRARRLARGVPHPGGVCAAPFRGHGSDRTRRAARRHGTGAPGWTIRT